MNSLFEADRGRRWALGLMCALCSTAALRSAAGETPAPEPLHVRLLSQYDYAPFQTNTNQGTTFELADYLTQKAKGAFVFRAEVLPRKRLDIYLTDPTIVWVVPWAVPRFFGSDALTRFAWTKPMMLDGNHLLSRRSQPVHYKTPEALAGLRLGGTLGHRYATLEPLLADGRLVREDCSNLLCNVEKLKLGRVDIVWMPSAAVSYFRQIVPLFTEDVYVSPQAVETLERSFMLPRAGPEALKRFMDTMAASMPMDPLWSARLRPAAPTP
jgi:polar amino acid transport system substrate-binding protein